VSPLLFETAEWDFDTVRRAYDAIEEIAVGELGLDVYPNRLEMISFEQMLDAYSSIGMPNFYQHWSFGKRFIRDEAIYRKGYANLAFEIVINSNPCISYLMEENTMTMQALVIAHAAFGHNHFFKNNYLFREHTDASAILDYLAFARAYIARCEELHGLSSVERILDAAHALMDQSVDRFGRRPRPRLADEKARLELRRQYSEEKFDDLWRTLPPPVEPPPSEEPGVDPFGRPQPDLPEDNLLFFLEKHSPILQPWQRELLRIVRNVAQYFLPQRLTKVMNEGCATFIHYKVMHRLHELGRISDGSLLEFIGSHTAATFQPDFDDPRYCGINPYALGFGMMADIERLVTDPTDEDLAFAPDVAGGGDAIGALKHVWANYRDDSFVEQFLSPQLIRKMRLFKLDDHEAESVYRVAAIHDERGYAEVRRGLASHYDPAVLEPKVEVIRAGLAGDRRLVLAHHRNNGAPLAAPDASGVLGYVADLWGYDVELRCLAGDEAAETLVCERPVASAAA